MDKFSEIENSLMIDFDKKDYKDSLGLITKDLTIYLNKTILKQRYPNFNEEMDIAQQYEISLRNKMPMIKLGKLEEDFTDNLYGLIKNTSLKPPVETPNKNQEDNSKNLSMNLFLNSMKAGKNYEHSLKIAKIDSKTVDAWYVKGKRGNEKYMHFYETYKELMLKNPYPHRKMTIFLDEIKSGKTEKEAIKKANITSLELKKWILTGKNSEAEYIDFYEDYLQITKEKSSEKKTKNNDLINEYIKLIDEGKTNKEAFEILNIPKFKVKNWKTQGKLGNKDYSEFYNTYLKAVNREELNKIKLFINLINEGKNNDEAIKAIKIPKFKIKQWFNQGKNGEADYIDFYDAYMKQYCETKEKIKPQSEKTCEICGRTINKKSSEKLCKRCRRKQRCANIVQELLLSIEPEVLFKKNDLKNLGLTGMQTQDYIWTLQEFNLIKKEKNNKYSLISKVDIEEFIEESGVEIKDSATNTVKLTKTCSTCGETLEISKFPVSENNPDGHEDNCKNCKKLINAASYLKELLSHIDYDTEYSENDLEKYYSNTFLLQAKTWPLLENDLLIKNYETDKYILAKQETCEEFLDKYFNEKTKIKAQKKPTAKSAKTKDIVLDAIHKDNTRKESAKKASIKESEIENRITLNKKSNDYDDEHNIMAREKFIENIRNGKTRKEAAKSASIELKLISNWIARGTQGQKPYDEFYEKYMETRKILKQTANSNEEKVKNEFINLLNEGYSHDEASRKIENGKYSAEIKKWYSAGKYATKKHLKFYSDCENTKNPNKIADNEDILAPLPHDINKFKKGTKTGFAWVSHSGNYYYYTRTTKNIRIKAPDIEKLHQKVIENNLDWGVINLSKAEKTLGKKPKIPKKVINKDILSPLSYELENKFKKNSRGTSTGFAWVNKTGKKYSYTRVINRKHINISEETIEKLHEKVISENLEWGVRDLTKAKQTLNQKIETKPINGSKTIDEVPAEDILSPLPKQFEDSFKSNKVNKTGIAWVNKTSRYWSYSRIIDGKPIKIKDSDIEKLHQKVIAQNLTWGIRDFEKANKIIITTPSSENESNSNDEDCTKNKNRNIFSPLPRKYKTSIRNMNKTTGIAWVRKTGNEWKYIRTINNNESIVLSDENIINLYNKVMESNLIWGVTDLNKAKKVINRETNDILRKLPAKVKAKIDKPDETGFGWVYPNKDEWEYYNVENNVPISIKNQNIYKLHEIIIKNNYSWGVINLNKALKTLSQAHGEIYSAKTKSEKTTDEDNGNNPVINILDPLPGNVERELENVAYETKTGFAWVSETENEYSYQKIVDSELIIIEDSNIRKLHKEVVQEKFIWGVRDLIKAKETLRNSDKKFNKILKPLPLKIKQKLRKNSKGNTSGFAWVYKIGNEWNYTKVEDGNTIHFRENDIYELYNIVIENNHIWGVRDLSKAKQTLKECNKKLPEPSKIDKIPKKTIQKSFDIPKKAVKNNDILSPLPDKYKNAIQIRHYHETGIAWVRKIGNLWVYGKRIDGKYVSIKDSNIYKLHKKVLKDGHDWGIINQEKAKETLFNAQPINTINSSPKEKQK
ncbi:hypothetical protein [Methanobrevibacter sp. V74]|uniref:hypothetical protein n=1 Tax=Methanobrevibacter sp. V74 TaxID=3064279 RepID=UPI0027363720|nr:hypothetical protein [Methanobrevibacter sp. V74]